MSNERKPLVTMADVRLHCGELNEREAVACRWIIERYERLITEGKLREVEDVEFDGRTDRCSGCGYSDYECHGVDFDYCPGCGSRIKR